MLATRSTPTNTQESDDEGDLVAPDEATTEPGSAMPPDDPPGPDGSADRSRRGRLRRASTWLTVVVVVLAIVATALMVAWRRSADETDRLSQQEQLRSSALAAARTYAADLTTYDHATLAEQQATLAGESTKRFQDTFADSMKTLGPIFERLEATATGTVLDAAVVTATAKRAEVIAFLDQVASSKEMDEPETQASRVSMTLVRQGDRWLLDRVELV